MKIIGMQSVAKLYEVMRGEKTDIVSSKYKKMGITQLGSQDGRQIIDTAGRRSPLSQTHTDPTILTKFFQLAVRPEKGVELDDKAIINIAKDIDNTVSNLLSRGGVFTELFKELKNAQSKFLLTAIVENNANIDSMMALDDRRGYFMEQADMQVGESPKDLKRVNLQQIVIKVSYDKSGRPLLRPEQQKLVLIHELMHSFDLVLSSKSATVKNLVQALRKSPIYTSKYSRTNDEEMVAELLAYYYLQSDYPEYAEQYKQLERLADSIKVKVTR